MTAVLAVPDVSRGLAFGARGFSTGREDARSFSRWVVRLSPKRAASYRSLLGFCKAQTEASIAAQPIRAKLSELNLSLRVGSHIKIATWLSVGTSPLCDGRFSPETTRARPAPHLSLALGAGRTSPEDTWGASPCSQPTAPKNNFLLSESGEENNLVGVRHLRYVVVCDCAVVVFSLLKRKLTFVSSN